MYPFKHPIIIVLCGLLPTLSVMGGITLVTGEKSNYVIVVAKEAPPAELTAAKELQAFFAAATKVELPIVQEAAGSPAIRVGGMAKTLPPDSIMIRTEGRDLILAGGGRRGALYAVYAFLEDQLGIRFWSPTDTYIPKVDNLTLPELTIGYTPDFAVRETGSDLIVRNPIFAARCRINGHWVEIPEAYGGHELLLGWCHTFWNLLPADQYFAAHPEWYARHDKERESGQLCLSNPEMRKELIANVLRKLRENPQTPVISVSQNDNERYCRCDACQKLAARYGGKQSGVLLDFVNEVAKAVEMEFPHTLVETLAYLYTVEIPKNIKPRDNVMVRLCTVRANVGVPLTSPKNAVYGRAITDWSALSRQLAVWNYIADFNGYLLPYPNWRDWDKDLRTFRDHRVKWIFEQGGSELQEMAEMRAYVISRLMWNPNRSGDALINEFLAGYYGKAAPVLKTYLNLMASELDRSNFPLNCLTVTTRDWLSYPALLKAMELMSRAQQLTADDPRTARHVLEAKLTPNFVFVSRPESFGAQDSRLRNALREILEVTKDRSERDFREGTSMAVLQKLMRLELGMGTKEDVAFCPNEFRDRLPNQVAIFRPEEFVCYEPGLYTVMENDAVAAGGRTIRLKSGLKDWLVQFHGLSILKLGAWDVYVSARAVMSPGKTPGKQPALAIGIYNGSFPETKEYTLTAQEIVHSDYRLFKAGEVRNISEYFYLFGFPDAGVANIYIDRIILVRKP